jgi:hypothetical protein
MYFFTREKHATQLENACGCDARHAEMPLVRAVELPVVKLSRDGLRAAELEAELDDAVLRRDVVADDGLMPFHCGLAILRWGGVTHLRALQRAVLEGKRRHHDGPALVLAQLGALEVIGEEQFPLLRDRLGGNRGQLRRIGGEGGGGDEGDGSEKRAEVHGDEKTATDYSCGRFWNLHFKCWEK